MKKRAISAAGIFVLVLTLAAVFALTASAAETVYTVSPNTTSGFDVKKGGDSLVSGAAISDAITAIKNDNTDDSRKNGAIYLKNIVGTADDAAVILDIYRYTKK